MEGGVELPLLFLSHLEVIQASSLHTPQLAKTEKESQEQSTKRKGLKSPARCFQNGEENPTYCTVDGQWWLMEGGEKCVWKSREKWTLSSFSNIYSWVFFYRKWMLNLFCQNNKSFQEKNVLKSCMWINMNLVARLLSQYDLNGKKKKWIQQEDLLTALFST